MKELEPRIHDDRNGLDYVLVGEIYLPTLKLTEEEETRPIGKWGRMHLRFIRENHPVLYSELTFSGRMATYLADINEQAQARLEVIIDQMKAAEGVTEDLKCRDWLRWLQCMNSIQNRAEEIILSEIIYQ